MVNSIISFIKKYYIFLILVFSVIVIFMFVYNFSNYDENAVVLNTEDNKITISNRLLMTDVVGKDLTLEKNVDGVTGYIEFDIQSLTDKRVNYEIYLTNDNLKQDIPIKFVKIYLTDDNDIPMIDEGSGVLTFYDMKQSRDNINDRVLYSGSLKNGESKKFKLRMWVADTYALTVNSKEFSVNLKVRVK